MLVTLVLLQFMSHINFIATKINPLKVEALQRGIAEWLTILHEDILTFTLLMKYKLKTKDYIYVK